MVKPDETEPAAENGQWGTWEELLLACAVNRYGTKSWDSVAVEIRKRSSAPITLTPHNCKAKYLDLKRRYRSATDSGTGAGADDVPWLDELRKVRVAELKRELERYDLTIVSLQMKVKSLTEERGSGKEKSDLVKCEEIEKNDEQKPEMTSPESADGAVKQESGGDNQSVNESNENLQTGEVKLENETNPVRTGEGPEPESGSPVREYSCNGSSDSKPVLEALKVEPVGEVSESAEVSGGGTKENSDVQSSASKSRNERNDVVHCGSRKDDEGEGEGEDDQSPAMKGNQAVAVKSQPLVDILQIVRSHKLGSVFEQRLESQEKLKYKNLIRQHINLKILQTRLEEGYYSDGIDKFFRDLLLLVNNAIVFFSKKSPESVAAIELRQLISKEMAKTKRNNPTDSSAEKQLSTTPPVTLPSKRAPDPSDSLLLEPKIAGPMIVCRKRSSIAAKASASASGADKKKEQQKATLAEEKQVLDLKQPDKSSDEHRITKKRTRDAFPSVAKKNGKSVRADASPNKTSETVSNQTQGKGGSPAEHSETRSDKKKKNPMEADAKKQGATNLLNRMKRGSSSNNGASLDSLDKFKGSADNDSENDIRGEQKKGSNKGDGRKDHQVPVPKRSSGGRQMKDQDSPTKRSVGRPPKRAAAPVPMSSAVTGKRSREVGDAEAVASKQTKKRPKK